MTKGLRKMKLEIKSLANRLCRDEGGTVVILVAMGIIAFLGLGALAIDVSKVVYDQRALQDTTDLAAQAGATEIYSGSGNSATATVTSYYNAKANSYNFQQGLNVTSVTATLAAVNGTATGGCPTTSAQLQYYPACTTSSPNGTSAGGCANSSGCNAILVTQQAKVSLALGEIFGIGPVTLTAKALAVGKGGALPPLNIMLVIDNTESMNTKDPQGTTCGGIQNATRIQCALAGAQTLLSELWATQDQVGLMVFPGVDPNASDTSNKLTSIANDGSCSSSVKSICVTTCNPSTGKCSCTGGGGSTADIMLVPYNASPSYQLVSPTNSGGGSTNSFCSASQGSCGSSTAMSTTSPIVAATCQSSMSVGATQCNSCAGEQVKGGEGTYFADAINQAQATLVATNDTGVCANFHCQNVIILLSDGGAGNAGDSEGGTANTSQQALAGTTTLTFASVPIYVVAGSTVADNTNSSAIPTGTTVVSATDSTVTISGAVTNLGAAATSIAASGSATLTFLSGSLPSKLAKGASVTDTTNTLAIPAGTTVTACSGNPCSSGTTVTLSNKVTVAAKDAIAFGFVGQGDQIAFSSNNQCNAAITAAHNAANAGTWVYSIAYGSGVGDQQQSQDTVANLGDYTSCSDTESPKVNSCYTMYQIASSPGAINDPTKFYSDPMGGSCTSPANPSSTSVPSIFSNIGYNLTYTTLLACGTSAAGGYC